ncbi:MAG: non-canonical purine NTP pyrophosphatase, RdgB/HAM1 family [Bdellovibrionaceae bacterium]|nr:non-canonical purine NTP pyrophosphatase, RdgB/HAM1 family [Pseudobdellovibrionaceae bacterium]|tara:strand:- start:191372 stop:191953 length:582 start_codon:yes stop_codon:yes gene_type:complete
MDIWLATSNSGKVNEFKSLLHGKGLVFHQLSEVKNYHSPAETGETFLDNARIKAKSLKSVMPDQWVVAEDSGLQVKGLKDLPGVHSARYAGDKATDHENVAKVMKMVNLRTPTERSAKFVCCIVAISPTGEEFVFDGVVEGSISKKVAGTAGFGYDVCFIPEGEEKTFAELGIPFKNKVSHRAQAIRKLVEIF